MKGRNGFYYEGLLFEPIGNLSGHDADFHAISRRIEDIGLTPSNWNYDEFYKVAKENNADVDLFKVGEYTVIPASNYLFKYI